MQNAAVLTPMPGKAAGRICEGRLRECMALSGLAFHDDAPDSGAMKKRRCGANGGAELSFRSMERLCREHAFGVRQAKLLHEAGSAGMSLRRSRQAAWRPGGRHTGMQQAWTQRR